jgi:hypothetical protein
MKRFIESRDRNQRISLPEQLDDYVADSNSVRIVDVFVDELDLAQMGFEGRMPAQTGRPAYHPSVLLKIYIYGYGGVSAGLYRARDTVTIVVAQLLVTASIMTVTMKVSAICRFKDQSCSYDRKISSIFN